MRFKCVWRTWCAHFQNPKFVARHLANQSKEHIFLRRWCLQKGTILNVISDVKDAGDVSFAVDLYLTSDKVGVPFYLVGHCNGIVALMNYAYRDFNRDVLVCNPGIRECRTLPKSSFHTFSENNVAYFRRRTRAVGFGYDHKTNDYKVVKVVSFKRDKITSSSRFEVFSLHSDSSWRQVKNVVVEATIKFRVGEEKMQYFDGAFYWCGRDRRTCEGLLLSFDIADEVFRKSPMPYFCEIGFQEIVSTSKHIGVYKNESIAMFVYSDYRLQVEKCIDVWVLKEFGVKESWTKQLTIGPFLRLYRPIVFWKNDELVLLQEDASVQGQLLYHDPVTLESKRLPLRGFWFRRVAVTYKKTLVSVNTGEDVVV